MKKTTDSAKRRVTGWAGVLAAVIFLATTLCACAETPKRAHTLKDMAQEKQLVKQQEYRIGDTGICGTLQDDHILVTWVDQGSPADGKVRKGDLIRGFQGRGLGKDIRRTVAKRISRLGRDWDWHLAVTVERPGLRGDEGNTIVLHLQLPLAPGTMQHFGPTGIYAKMYHDRLVVEKVAENSPADGSLQPGDHILEVDGKPLAGDIYKLFTACINAAETRKRGGILQLQIKRPENKDTDAKIFNIELKLEVLGKYNPKAPFTSPRADAIITRAADAIIENKEHGRLGIGLLALLATGEDRYIEYVGNVLHGSKFAQPDVKLSMSASMTSWPWAYQTITLCEYYLLTKDEFVMPAIRAHALTIAKGQDAAGLWNHRMADPAANFGQLHGRLYGYGAINQTSIALWISLILAEKCGVEHPEVRAAIEKTHRLYGNWIDKGALPYGNHGPMERIFTNNGTSGSVAVAYSLLDDTKGAKFYSRMSTAAHDEILTGHSGPYFNIFWSGLGANVAGPEAAAAFNQKVHWLRTLTRTADGRFLYMEARGDHFNYSRCSSTGANLLNYCAGRRAIFIAGKDADQSIWLTPKAAKDVVQAGRIDFSKQTTEALLDLLGSSLPKVRLRAAQMLAVKDADADDKLMRLLADGTRDQRIGAIHAIQTLKINAAADELMTIAGNENEDLWIRQLAVKTLSEMKGVRKYGPELLDILVADKPHDKFGDLNITLGFALVKVLQPDPYALDLDTEMFYRGVSKLLNHKHMWGRISGMKLIRKIPMEDLYRVADKMLSVIKDKDRSYTSYHGDGHRQTGLEILNSLNIREAIPLTIDTIKEKTGRGGPRMRGRMRLLKTFGAEAKPYIPQIRQTLGKRAEAVVKTIEESNSARDMISLEKAREAGAKNDHNGKQLPKKDTENSE